MFLSRLFVLLFCYCVVFRLHWPSTCHEWTCIRLVETFSLLHFKVIEFRWWIFAKRGISKHEKDFCSLVLTVPMIVTRHGSCGVVLPDNCLSKLLQTPYLCKFETLMFTYSQRNRIREIFYKSRPANSHGFTVSLTVWGINSRSHDLASKSHGESENLKIAKQFR